MIRSFSKVYYKRPTLTQPVFTVYLTLFGRFHLNHTITAQNVDDFGCSYTLVAMRTDVLAGTAWLTSVGRGVSGDSSFGKCSQNI